LNQRIVPRNGLIEWSVWTYADNRMFVQTQYLSRLKRINSSSPLYKPVWYLHLEGSHSQRH